MRKLVQKQRKANNRVAPVTKSTKDNLIGLIYVNEQYDGWRAESLRMLRSRFDISARSFPSDVDEEILEAIHNTCVDPDVNFRNTQKTCMPFLRLKKDEAVALGVQALDLKPPFREMEVLLENLDLIKRHIDLHQVVILDANDPDARARAGSFVDQIDQNPPYPGNPIAILRTQ